MLKLKLSLGKSDYALAVSGVSSQSAEQVDHLHLWNVIENPFKLEQLEVELVRLLRNIFTEALGLVIFYALYLGFTDFYFFIQQAFVIVQLSSWV